MFHHLLKAALGRLARSGPAGELSGRAGEQMAYWYLRDRGFTLVARNYRRAGLGGEVDLIGWEKGTLVFVEVKTRSSAEIRHAEDAVDAAKRERLVLAARDYRRRAHLDAPYRFDVVAVYPVRDGAPRIEHFRDAFREAGTTGAF
jgi:putative endonuclease